jgi:hypothetical protein
VVLGGCRMTHMDDQVAKHIKEMILRITWRPLDNQEQPRKPDTLNQIVRMLRRGPEHLCDLMPLKQSSWWDDTPKT